MDYLFRYDRGGFWTGKYAFEYFMTPFNRITRYLLDPLMHASPMYRAAHQSSLPQQHVIQDFMVPHASAEESMRYVDAKMNLYPLWLCPFRLHDPHETSLQPSSWRNLLKDTMLLNIGVWDPVKGSPLRLVEINRSLEAKVKLLSGMRWLCVNAF